MNKEEIFLQKVETFLLEEKLLARGDKILIGFSGGADSTALVTVLYYLRSKYNLHLLAAHVNYHLRGADSDADEQFVKEFCFSHNISVLVNHYKPEARKINENSLREYRLKWFDSLVKSYKLQSIALGHNKSDQAETVLLRLMRGSLITGLSGIKPRRDNIIHPLLSFGRGEISSYLKSEEIGWREDSSNQDQEFNRNKIRNNLLPWIQREINPRASDKIAEMVPYLQQVEDILKKSAAARLHKIIDDNTDELIIVNIPALLRVPEVIRFYLYRDLVERIAGTSLDFYQGNFLEMEKAIVMEGNRQIMMPHEIYLLKEYDQLKFFKHGKPQAIEPEIAREISNVRPRFVYDSWRVTMKKLKKLPEKKGLFLDRTTAYLDFDKLSWPLVVRHREAGDSFVPFGMKHHKKLKDFFIDIKLAAHERARIPVFADQKQIIWIGGLRIDQRLAITEKTANILMLKVEKIKKRKARPAERMKKR